MGPCAVFLRRRRVQAVVNSAFSLSSGFALNLFAPFCITCKDTAILTMKTQSPVQGYVDPNFPNPNGPDDASIIICSISSLMTAIVRSIQSNLLRRTMLPHRGCTSLLLRGHIRHPEHSHFRQRPPPLSSKLSAQHQSGSLSRSKKTLPQRTISSYRFSIFLVLLSSFLCRARRVLHKSMS